MAANSLRDRRLVVQGGFALVLANARYWTSVAPVVRRELRRWQLRAELIGDPELRALALSKLHGESFHAEAAAMLATFAPRTHRSSVVEAIVALELLYDYLDGLSERSCEDPIGEGQRLFTPYIDAVTPGAQSGGEAGREDPPLEDGGYLEALSATVSAALTLLPSARAIAAVAARTAARAGQAQTRMHAVPALGLAQLEDWARAEAEGGALEWRQLVAGAASSVLVLHALIAAAANPRTRTRDSAQIEEAYLSICVLLTLLDGLVDDQSDTSPDRSASPGYLNLYEQSDELAETMAAVARHGIGQARALPNGARHVMLFTGVVAYYLSAPGAENELAQPVATCLRRELAPLVSPTLAIMRAWRGMRRPARSSGAKGGGGS